MARLQCVTKPNAAFFIGFPYGDEAICWNAHRIYGPKRSAHMFANIKITESSMPEYVDKANHNQGKISHRNGRLCIHTLNSLQSVLQNLMEYALQVSLPTVRVLTIADKVQWNIGGARNLLMHRALHCRTVMMDIDYIMPESLAVEMLKAKAPSHVIYRLKRNHPGKDPMHPGIMFTSPHTYFGIGGADEDFAGHYGFTDPHLVLRAHRAGVKVKIFRSSELLVPQPKSTNRPSVERDPTHNTKLFESKKEGKVPWSNTYLRFRWTESVISKQD